MPSTESTNFNKSDKARLRDKRFIDRHLESLEVPVSVDWATCPPLATPTAVPKPASKRAGKVAKAAPKPALEARTLSHARPAGREVAPPRIQTRAAAGALTPKGISVAEIKRFAWKPSDCGDALRLLAKKNGVSVKRGEDRPWRAAK